MNNLKINMNDTATVLFLMTCVGIVIYFLSDLIQVAAGVGLIVLLLSVPLLLTRRLVSFVFGGVVKDIKEGCKNERA